MDNNASTSGQGSSNIPISSISAGGTQPPVMASSTPIISSQMAGVYYYSLPSSGSRVGPSNAFSKSLSNPFAFGMPSFGMTFGNMSSQPVFSSVPMPSGASTNPFQAFSFGGGHIPPPAPSLGGGLFPSSGIPLGGMPSQGGANMYGGAFPPYSGFQSSHPFDPSGSNVPGSSAMSSGLNIHQSVGQAPHNWNSSSQPRLPFLATLNLPDLTKLTNDPVMHLPYWPPVPATIRYPQIERQGWRRPCQSHHDFPFIVFFEPAHG